MKGNQKLTSILIAVGAAVVLVASFVIYKLTRPVVKIDRYVGEIPYVWDQFLNVTIDHYVHDVPSSSIALISGPYQSGKSRLMNIIAKQSANEGRFVIDLDLSNVNTYDDLLIAFRQTATDSLTNLQKTTLKKLPKSYFKANTSLPELETFTENIQTFYRGLYNSLKSVKRQGFSENGLQEFFRLLREAHSSIKPIILIHNFDKLYSLRNGEDAEFGLKLIEALKAKQTERLQYEATVPIILEIKDSYIRLTREFSNVYRFFEVTKFKKLKTELANLKVFTSAEVRKISFAFGSHAGSYAHILERLRTSQKIDDAISAEIEAVKAEVQNYPIPANVKDICGLLPADSYSVKLDPLRPLIQRGLIYINSQMKVTFANKAVKKAICN